MSKEVIKPNLAYWQVALEHTCVPRLAAGTGLRTNQQLYQLYIHLRKSLGTCPRATDDISQQVLWREAQREGACRPCMG